MGSLTGVGRRASGLGRASEPMRACEHEVRAWQDVVPSASASRLSPAASAHLQSASALPARSRYLQLAAHLPTCPPAHLPACAGVMPC